MPLEKESDMNKLSYQTLKEIGYDGYLLEDAPERVLQSLGIKSS